jgi:pimeloyl-ACP methyl ester carboxylesterase
MYKITQFQHKNIHYRDEGSGDVLVLLHGFLETLNMWNDFYDEIGNKMRIISIDFPGHGLSKQVSDTHSMSLMADIVKHVLDLCKVERCVLSGHSMGGYVSMQFAESYPEMLQGLCLFHSHAQADSEEQKLNRDRVIEIIEQNHHRFIHTFIPNLFAENNKEKYLLTIEQLQEQAKKISAESIAAAAKGMKERKSQLETLATAKFPILFIIGKLDPRTPLNIMLVQIAMPKHSEALILDDCGHMGHIEEKEKTIKALWHFAEKCV